MKLVPSRYQHPILAGHSRLLLHPNKLGLVALFISDGGFALLSAFLPLGFRLVAVAALLRCHADAVVAGAVETGHRH